MSLKRLEYQEELARIDDIIAITLAVSNNHPNFVERGRAKVAYAYAKMMDELQPDWRLHLAAFLRQHRELISKRELPMLLATNVHMQFDIAGTLVNILGNNDDPYDPRTDIATPERRTNPPSTPTVARRRASDSQTKSRRKSS